MSDINNDCLGDKLVVKKVVKGKLVFVSFSKNESVGLKDSMRDILTDSFEKRYMKSVKQSSES